MSSSKPAILVTGGAGSIGSALVEHLLKTKGSKYTIRVFDSDEYGIWRLQQKLKGNPNVRFLIGSVRDYPRLEQAMHGVEHVFHCAAYKHVALCEFNPFDAVETNIIGTQNTIRAAFASESVNKFLYISTDKAVNPTSLMGATKLIGERLVVAANHVTGLRPTILSVARFPNVIKTRGNVFEAWYEQLHRNGKIMVTDEEMTRYFVSVETAIKFLSEAFDYMKGAEIFIPNLSEEDVHRIVDVAKEWLKKQTIEGEIIYGSPEIGEKMHENLYSSAEAPYVEQVSDIMSVVRAPKFDFVHWIQPKES